jgi:hypothetical protein
MAHKTSSGIARNPPIMLVTRPTVLERNTSGSKKITPPVIKQLVVSSLILLLSLTCSLSVFVLALPLSTLKKNQIRIMTMAAMPNGEKTY